MLKKSEQTKNRSVKTNTKKNILLFNRKGESRIYLFLSFLIPFVIIWYFFAQNKVHPFGDKQILVTDLWHQYYPFFRVEHEKLHNLSSFLYSWEAGLGTNFISLMSYYAGSPLNLLAVFFPIEYSRDALTLFLTLKIACAGLFCGIFLKNTFNKNDFSITAFAVCYALSDFIMGYYWNIIWIDTVALLPLVVLGVVKLYREGKYKLYIISLALSLTTSFYIGMFTCIFTVMVFAAMTVIDWDGSVNIISMLLSKDPEKKKSSRDSFKKAFMYFLKRTGQITGATLIGAGIGAVILIPAYFGLMLTNSANNQFPAEVTYYEPWLKMISAVTGFHQPTAKEGLPNFFCGMFAIVLMGAFLRSGKIKFREKFVTAAYLMFIVISCNMNVLNYMWHGFHFTNMLPYRFSFLLSFILIAAGYRAYTVMAEEANFLDVAALPFIAGLIIYVSYKHQPKDAMKSCIIVSIIYIAVMLIYTAVSYFCKKKGKKINLKGWLGLAVCVVCVSEMAINAKIGVETVTVTDYTNYPRKSAAITGLVDELESKDSEFFRMETTTHYSINDPALYGYRGISQFSSTANVNVTRLMHDLGIDASEAGNRYYYNQNTAVFNTFMNLKYILSTDNYSGDLTYLKAKASNEGVNAFENVYYLPLGFTATNSALNYAGGSANQFENQNELFRRVTGVNKDVFKRLEIKNVGHKNLDVTKTGYGDYHFQYESQDTEDTKAFLKYNYDVIEDGPVYAVFKFDDISSVRIKSGDSVIHTQNNIDKYVKIFAAGEFKAGDVVTFQTDVEENKSGRGTIYVYQIDRGVFEEGYYKLAAGKYKITDYGDTHISGTIKADKNCIMYTSIPYDGGWRAYVDGKRSEVKSVGKALVCVPLTEGEHTVELKYYPPGFIAGLIITVIAIAVFVLLCIFEPKFKLFFEERKKLKSDSAGQPGQEGTEETDAENTENDGGDKPEKSDRTGDTGEAEETGVKDTEKSEPEKTDGEDSGKPGKNNTEDESAGKNDLKESGKNTAGKDNEKTSGRNGAEKSGKNNANLPNRNSSKNFGKNNKKAPGRNKSGKNNPEKSGKNKKPGGR